MKILRHISLALATGYIFVYFSEHLFWARPRPDDSIGGWLATWLVYSLMAYVFLWLVASFRVHTLWALFLAGAAFGWIGEGLVVQTAYDMLPLSISFTGLAWHALITVWVGWYTLQKSFTAPDGWLTLKLSALIGLAYGLWAIFWWQEPDGGVASVAEFALFSFVTTLLVMIAYGLSTWSLSEPYVPNRWGILVVGVLFGLYFIFVTIPTVPIAILVLSALMSLVFLGLTWNRDSQPDESILSQWGESISAWKYLSLLALPATAVAFYALATALHLQWQTNWILYLITTPLGFILFGVSLYKIWRKKTHG